MTTTAATRVTRQQRRNLAGLVLSHGFDNLCEFYGELLSNRDYTAGVEVPEWEQAYEILVAWHRTMIDLADQA